jgi:hypothetical protein
MDADNPGKKASVQKPPPEDEADKEKVKQADQHSDTKTSDVPKPDPKDTKRKIETFGAVGAAVAAAAILPTILPK